MQMKSRLGKPVQIKRLPLLLPQPNEVVHLEGEKNNIFLQILHPMDVRNVMYSREES